MIIYWYKKVKYRFLTRKDFIINLFKVKDKNNSGFVRLNQVMSKQEMLSKCYDCLLPCHICVSEWIYTPWLSECQGTPCSKQAWYMKFKWSFRLIYKLSGRWFELLCCQLSKCLQLNCLQIKRLLANWYIIYWICRLFLYSHLRVLYL